MINLRLLFTIVLALFSSVAQASASVDETTQLLTYQYRKIFSPFSPNTTLPTTQGNPPRLDLYFLGKELAPGDLFGEGWCLNGVNTAPAFLVKSDQLDELDLVQCGRKTTLKVIPLFSQKLGNKNIHDYLNLTASTITTQFVLADLAEFHLLETLSELEAQKLKKSPSRNSVWLDITIKNGAMLAVADVDLVRLNGFKTEQVFDKLGRAIRRNPRYGGFATTFSYIKESNKLEVIGFTQKRETTGAFDTTVDFPLRRLSYNDKGFVEKMEDVYSSASGKSNQWIFTYNAQNMLASIQLNQEPPSTFSYDKNKRLSDVKDENGMHQAFFYESDTNKLLSHISNMKDRSFSCIDQYTRLNGNSSSKYRIVASTYCKREKIRIVEYSVDVDKYGITRSTSQSLR